MRNIKLTGFALAIALFALSSCQSNTTNTNSNQDSTTDKPNVQSNNNNASSAPKSDTVIIENMQFNPADLSINKGDTVVWINKDIVVHNVTEATSQAWTSGDIKINTSWSQTPTNSYHYICSIHPTMKGSITIK
ncbi:MAG: hypothetical protein LC122_14670 [Chitinophagales bacterium]|nr:hypothetical protein [Chitinophagales bacterium]